MKIKNPPKRRIWGTSKNLEHRFSSKKYYSPPPSKKQVIAPPNLLGDDDDLEILANSLPAMGVDQ